jgi:hypothetical protein
MQPDCPTSEELGAAGECRFLPLLIESHSPALQGESSRRVLLRMIRFSQVPINYTSLRVDEVCSQGSGTYQIATGHLLVLFLHDVNCSRSYDLVLR